MDRQHSMASLKLPCPPEGQWNDSWHLGNLRPEGNIDSRG
jgi:hypothetical protein